ncbi:MAG: aminotransferase class I/II-fold pyridoxal phosphate-dependent enzyme [Calditrichaeota bacterium]|nr:MAG: aminotransferase class I/II-fold pyridoxal phosphate-dependent enzyme [Calditrichota bacterium]
MKIRESDRLQQMSEYYFSHKLREVRDLIRQGKRIINLGIGNPDLPPPPVVIQTLQQSADGVDNHGYQPYQGIPELREAMAEWYFQTYHVALNGRNEILPLMGSKEGIVHISLAFLNKGDEVLVPDPGYLTYRSAAQLAGAKIVPYPLREEKGWLPDLEELTSLVTQQTRLIWINYPHMPTGSVATLEIFSSLVEFAAKHHLLLCHDNPYSLILNPSTPISIFNVPQAYDCCLELNSLSKTFNMAGWRVGMVVGQTTFLKSILKVKSNMDSGMFLPIQHAAIQALKVSRDWFLQQNQEYETRRTLVHQFLDRLNCQYQPQTAGLFVWGKLPGGMDSRDMTDWLLSEYGIFVAPGDIFGEQGKGYIRVSLCAPKEQIAESVQRVENVKARMFDDKKLYKKQLT